MRAIVICGRSKRAHLSGPLLQARVGHEVVIGFTNDLVETTAMPFSYYATSLACSPKFSHLCSVLPRAIKN